MISQPSLLLALDTTNSSGRVLQKLKAAVSCDDKISNDPIDSLQASTSENATTIRRRRGRPSNSRTAEQRRRCETLKQLQQQQYQDDVAEVKVCSSRNHTSPPVTSRLPAETGKPRRAENKLCEKFEKSFEVEEEQFTVPSFVERSANLDYNDADDKQLAPNNIDRISTPISHNNLHYNTTNHQIKLEPMKHHYKIPSCTSSPQRAMISQEPLQLALKRTTNLTTNCRATKAPKFTSKSSHNSNNNRAPMVHLMLLVSILQLAFNIGQITCLRRNDHWTERNTSSSSLEQPQLGDLVAIGAISLLEPTTTTTTTTTTNTNQQFKNNGKLVDQIFASPLADNNNKQNGARINKLDYIVEFMRTNKLTKFCDLLTNEEPEIRELNERLNLLNQFTLFVPTNEAILLMPPSQMEQIKSSAQETKQFLLAHATSELVAPKMPSSSSSPSLPENTRTLVFSLAGSPLHISTTGSGLPPSASMEANPLVKQRHLELIVNGANIINGQSYALQEQSNQNNTYAIVHLIDRVLYPVPNLKLREMLRLVAPKMARYLDMASDSNLDTQLSSIDRFTTVLAPNDDSFKSVPKKVIEQLDTNRTFLINFLRGHLIEGLYYGPQLSTLGGWETTNTNEMNLIGQTTNLTTNQIKLNSLSGTELQFELKRLQSRNLILVNSIPIIEQDLVGLNGLVHLIARPIFEGHLSETCRCGLLNSQQGNRMSAGNLTSVGNDLAAYEKLWSTSAPNRPSVGPRLRQQQQQQDEGGTSQAGARTSGSENAPGSLSSVNWAINNGASRATTIASETPATGNELEREESNQAPVARQQDKMALISQRIRAQRSGLVTRNNKDFYRPMAAPANLLLAPQSSVGDAKRQQELPVISVPPISLIEASDLERQRNAKLQDATGSGVSSPAQIGSGRLQQFGDFKTSSVDNVRDGVPSDLFEVERYKIILNADTRQRMREQQQQQQQQQQQGTQNSASVRQFAYDRSLVTDPGTGSGLASDQTSTASSTRRPYSPIVNNVTGSQPSANNSGWSSSTSDQLTLSASSNTNRQQRLLKFQPEDARDPAATRLAQNSTNNQVIYNVDEQQQGASSSRQQQMMGKTVAPGGGFGGCAFYDTDCKRLFGRLVRLPTGGKKEATGGSSKQQQQQNQPLLLLNNNNNNINNLTTINPNEQHLDSTFGETTETPLGGGWTKSMPIQTNQKLQQPPVKAFHRLSPARVSPLNQPLPPWGDEERDRPPLAPNWRAQDRDIARITGPFVGPDKKHQEQSFGPGFTNGISRDITTTTTTSGKLALNNAALKQPPAEQIYLTPVGVIQAHQLQQQNHSSLKMPSDPQELLRDGNKAIFVSPSPILRISQPARNIIQPNRGTQSTISFSNSQQYHTPTPYSVSLITTHLPPIFHGAPSSSAGNGQQQQQQQFSRLTNFTAIDHATDDQLAGFTNIHNNNSNNKRLNLQQQQQLQFGSHIPRAPAAHRKQRLHQVQMDNNGSLGANFELNPSNGEKQSRRIVRLQANSNDSPTIKQTILANNNEQRELQQQTNGDISVTSARLTSPSYNNQNQFTFGSLATQASNQAPNVTNNNNLIRSAPILDAPTTTDQATIDFFQDRTIAEIMDDSGLRIDGQQVTFSRLKECLTDADLLSLVSQTGSSVTIFMPTDSAFQRLVQQQAIAQQQPSRSASGRSLDLSRRSHLLPLVARRPKSGQSFQHEQTRRQVGDISSGADLSLSLNDPLATTTTTSGGATNAAERLTLDCSSNQLRQVLLDHLSARLITPKQLQHDQGISSLSGHQLLLSSVPTKKIVVVDGQPVIAATRAKNGMVYVVNKFLNLTQQMPNVVDLMETQQNLTTFLSYLRFSSLTDRLKRETGPLTVLAPTNEAFEQLSSSARQLINSDPAALMDILRGHIVEGAQFGKLLSMRNQLRTMNPDQKIDAKVIKPNVYLFDNQMTSMRLVGTTGNGVVNSIDRLIVPSWLKVTLGSSSNNKPLQPATTSGVGSANLFSGSNSQQLNQNGLVGSSTARNPLFVGELEGDSRFVSVGTPPVLGNSASLNLPVISSQPVRFEQPNLSNNNNKETNFIANNFLLPDLNNNSSTSFNNNNSRQTQTGGNSIFNQLNPTTTSTSINSLDTTNSSFESSPFSRVANNLTTSGGPKRTNANIESSRINQLSPQITTPSNTLNNNNNNNNPSLSNVNVTKNMQLIEKLANLMQARKFVKYLIRSRVSEQLKPDMNYVILVPTDQAIEKLPKQIIDMLERDLERLADLMNYHILDTTFEYINTIPDGQTLNTLNEKDILFNWHRNNTILTASGAVVMGGIQEDNIALLIVDRVLYPTPGDILNIISKSPILSKFTSLVRNAGLERQLTLAGPYTLFAPSDFAFNQLNGRQLLDLERNKESARRFLLRHLSQPTVFTSSIALSNGTQMLITNSLGEDLILRQRNDYFSVNDVNFSYADVAATNGVVHVIDGPL